MKYKLYQADAFTHELFGGNPAAVCPLDEWFSDEMLLKIANENNLAETAFYVQRENEIDIRWFTPKVEVDLCGHATLAAAFVLFNYEGYAGNEILFHSHRSGLLKVLKEGKHLTLDFPADDFKSTAFTSELISGFNVLPQKVYKGKTDYMLLFKNEQEIRELVPDLSKIAGIKGRGVIVTAKGDEVDFVSRFFAPQSGIDEDPVTGSAHTTLTPYWAKELNKQDLCAIQLSARKGYLQCVYRGDRVLISGQVQLYLRGELHLSPEH